VAELLFALASERMRGSEQRVMGGKQVARGPKITAPSVSCRSYVIANRSVPHEGWRAGPLVAFLRTNLRIGKTALRKGTTQFGHHDGRRVENQPPEIRPASDVMSAAGPK